MGRVHRECGLMGSLAMRRVLQNRRRPSSVIPHQLALPSVQPFGVRRLPGTSTRISPTSLGGVQGSRHQVEGLAGGYR